MTDAVVAQVQGADESDLVAIVLAHPLNPTDKQRLGLPEDVDCNVNTTVKVLHDHARTLIGAGYAQVDPEDKAAVKQVLDGDPQPVDTGAEAPAAGEGTDQDAQPVQSSPQSTAPADQAVVASADPAAPVPVAKAARKG